MAVGDIIPSGGPRLVKIAKVTEHPGFTLLTGTGVERSRGRPISKETQANDARAIATYAGLKAGGQSDRRIAETLWPELTPTARKQRLVRLKRKMVG